MNIATFTDFGKKIFNTLKKCAIVGSVYNKLVTQNFYRANILQMHKNTSKTFVNNAKQVLVY